MRLYLDIETLPAPDELKSVLRELYDKQTERKLSFDDYWRGTSLNANFGRIFCIGYAHDDQPAAVLTGGEVEQLKRFWKLTKGVDQLVGHAILGFDLPFLIKRSIIHGLPINRQFRLTKGLAPNVYDTKVAWDIGAGPSISLDTFAKIFGFETSKQGIDGSRVYEFWQAGKHQAIYDYCRQDVELTRKIFERLIRAEET